MSSCFVTDLWWWDMASSCVNVCYSHSPLSLNTTCDLGVLCTILSRCLCTLWSKWVTDGFVWSVMFVYSVSHGWSVQPPCGAKTFMLDIIPNFLTKLFHTGHACKHHWCLGCYTTFSGLDPLPSITRSVESKTSHPRFLAHVADQLHVLENEGEKFCFPPTLCC